MASTSAILSRVRLELGDQGSPFQNALIGDGLTTQFDLGVGLIRATGFSAKTIAGATVTNLVENTHYTLDRLNGVLTTTAPVADGVTLFVQGSSTDLFTDEELEMFIHDAFLQHTSGRTVQTRYRTGEVGQSTYSVPPFTGAGNSDPWEGWTAQDTTSPPNNVVTAYAAIPNPHPAGMIAYTEDPITMKTLPEVEESLVAYLATIEALWALSTDAATDVDIQSAEGTYIQRSQRYRQLLQQIDMLTEKYTMLCKQLNVGLFRIEVSTLRRVARSTNRLVPLFKPREYDDSSMPVRMLPPIDERHVDDSGIPSPAYYSGLG